MESRPGTCGKKIQITKRQNPTTKHKKSYFQNVDSNKWCIVIFTNIDDILLFEMFDPPSRKIQDCDNLVKAMMEVRLHDYFIIHTRCMLLPFTKLTHVDAYIISSVH